MSLTLGNITLPNPVNIKQETVQIASENLLLDGRTTKKIIHTKYRYVLDFQHLTQMEVNAILAEYELQETRTFQSTETYMPVTARDVHIDIAGRTIQEKGTEFRENLTLILTEVRGAL